VEHPITEWITGVDLVAEMVRVAAGERLTLRQESITRRGAALECRVYAEDPSSGFLPSPGRIETLRAPSGPWVRDDSGFYDGAVVPSHYDPLISKLSVWAPDRRAAIARMERALSEYVVTGIRTNLAYHQNLMRHPEFRAGRYHTGFIQEHFAELVAYATIAPEDERAVAAAIAVATSRAEQRAAHAARISSGSGGGGDGGEHRPAPWVMPYRSFR
jgi:acetyl-CoA carboxylase biotin carboxylase subunit